MKKIDAVKTVRDIRDRMYAQTRGMSRKQLIEFYRLSATGFVVERRGKVVAQ